MMLALLVQTAFAAEPAEPPAPPPGTIAAAAPVLAVLSDDPRAARLVPPRATITTGAGIVLLGPVQQSDVEGVLVTTLPLLRTCYQRALDGTPMLDGSLTVAFSVTGEGAVPFAGVRASTLAAPDLDACLTTTLLRARFPALGAPSYVAWTFVFRSE